MKHDFCFCALHLGNVLLGGETLEKASAIARGDQRKLSGNKKARNNDNQEGNKAKRDGMRARTSQVNEACRLGRDARFQSAKMKRTRYSLMCRVSRCCAEVLASLFRFSLCLCLAPLLGSSARTRHLITRLYNTLNIDCRTTRKRRLSFSAAQEQPLGK